MNLLAEHTLKHLAERWKTVDTAALEPAFALLARGTPVRAREIAEVARIPESRARDALASDRTGKDKEGHLVELFGVSILTGAYRARFEDQGDERELSTCCALVALMMPALVGRPAEISGRDPVTREGLVLRVDRLRIRQVAPASMVATLVETEARALMENPGESFCQHVRLFASPASASTFASRDPRRWVLAVEELFAIGQALYRAVWDPSARPVTG